MAGYYFELPVTALPKLQKSYEIVARFLLMKEGFPQLRRAESIDTFKGHKSLYDQRMVKVCRTIKNRCGTEAYALVEGESNLVAILRILANFSKTESRKAIIDNTDKFLGLSQYQRLCACLQRN
jgi:hypothetical protein